MPESPIKAASRALVYLPGLGRDQLNSAAVIARSIASSANRDVAGNVAVTEKSPPAPPGLKAVCTIVANDAEEARLLDVFELDYRDRLTAMDRRNGSEAAPRGPLQAAVTAIVALIALVPALTRTNKSRRAKIQLALGLLVTSLLIVWAAYLMIAAIGTLIATATGDTPTGFWSFILTPGPAVVLFGGLLTGTTYVVLRDKIILAANRVAQLIDYHTRPDKAKILADSVGTAINALRDQGIDREIHLVAYSFGSTVLLNTVLPLDGNITTRPGSFAHSITSMTTIGCPADLVQLYRPDYYQNRHALVKRPGGQQIAWNNIFIASDIFASNFCTVADVQNDDAPENMNRELNGPKSLEQKVQARKANVVRSDEREGPTNGPGDLEVNCYRYLPHETLTAFGWIRQTALRQHARYWEENGGCWSFVVDQWLPATVQRDLKVA